MNWNATAYQKQHSYVWQHGESLLDLLNAQSDEYIVDLGCGTGQLTEKIAASGASVIGLDSDRAMIDKAQSNYPHIPFRVADATDFQLDTLADAIFSNAVLHWVRNAEAAAIQIAKALKPEGRFVAEFGGHGNVQTIIQTLNEVTEKTLEPWYFPTVGEYASLLEKHGLEVVYANLFDRPTPLGETGLIGWLDMFGQRFFSHLPAQSWDNIAQTVESRAKNSPLYQDGEWVADYRRLRIVAIKTDERSQIS